MIEPGLVNERKRVIVHLPERNALNLRRQRRPCRLDMAIDAGSPPFLSKLTSFPPRWTIDLTLGIMHAKRKLGEGGR